MRIGTASVRRRAQLLALEPELSIEPLRGNIDTRLRKRGERGLDAIVLAACGLDRLGLAPRSTGDSSRTSCCPRRARARSRCRCVPGEEELVAAADDARDAAPRRGRAALRRRRRRRMSRAGGRVSRRHDAHGSRRRRGRLVGAAGQRRRSGSARPRARGARRGRLSFVTVSAQTGSTQRRYRSSRGTSRPLSQGEDGVAGEGVTADAW